MWSMFSIWFWVTRALIGGQEPQRAGGSSSFSCLGQAWGFGSGIWPAGQPITGCEEPFWTRTVTWRQCTAGTWVAPAHFWWRGLCVLKVLLYPLPAWNPTLPFLSQHLLCLLLGRHALELGVGWIQGTELQALHDGIVVWMPNTSYSLPPSSI